MKFKEKISKKLNKIKKKSRKVLSLGLASFLVCNSIADVGVTFADEKSSKSSITVNKVGDYMRYIADRHGGTLDIPLKMSNQGDLAYCLEGAKPHPTGQTYTQGGVLEDGIKYILEYKPNTGNSNKDYYVKQAALYYYKGHATWIQYAAQNKNLADLAIQIANEAKSKNTKSSDVSITASPRKQDFKLVGNNYETDWFNVSIKGDLTSYRMDIKGAPSGTQIINSSGNVVSTLTKNDTKFKLRVPKSSVKGNYEIKIRLSGEFISTQAKEYIPSDSKYQRLAILKKEKVDQMDKDYITANLAGTGDVEVTKVSENGNVLKGAGFKLVKDGKDATSVKETGADGKVKFSDLSPGTYEVVETKAPTGHVLNGKKQTVTVTAGNTAKVEVSNEIIKGRVKVLKVDEETNEPLKGAEFELREKATGKVVEKLITGEDGTAISGLHPFKEYVLQETKAPDKYTLNGQEYFITISEHMQTIEVTAKNRIIKGQIAVNKSDSEINGLNLEGVEFEITNEEGSVVDTLVTDKNGYAISKVLNHGKYYLKETKTLPTHILNEKVYEVNITEDGKVYTYDIKNDVIKGKIQIVKVDKENEEVPVEGAIFDVIAENVFGVETGTTVDTITSDKDGFAYTKDLRAGRYKIVETFAPEGYWQSDKEYFVDVTEHGKVYVRYISNEPIQSKLRVVKLDDNTKLPLKDAKFKIVNKKTGEDVEFTEFWGIIPIKKTVFTTDENGEFITPQHLKYGTYELVEVEAPEGYNLAEPIEFVINEDTPMEDIELLGTITTQEVINTRITGNMELLKIDEETKEPLENVEFKVTCTNGFMKDNTWSLKSDIDGKVYLKDLEYGKYKIEEVKTIDGYVLNSAPIEFEIKEHGKTVKLEMTNKKIKGFVEINKTDSETGRVLEGAEFTIWNMHKAEVDKLVTNEKGYAKSKELDYGRYVMKETKAPNGYILSDKIYEIEITEDGKVYTYDITNDVKKGDLEFSKTDVSTGEIVEGAKIEITGLDETNNHIKFDFISSKDDKFTLPVGKYEFEEVIAPDGYVLNEEVGTFEIKENGDVVKAELKNKKIEGTLLFEKTDVSTGDVIDGAHIKIECIEGFDKGKVIEFISSKDGNKFSLLYGKYRITETMAPNGYIKTDEVGEFEITEDGQIVKAQLKNQRMIINTENPKTGDKGIAIPAVIAIGSLVGLAGIGIYNRSQYEYYYEDEEEEYDE